MSKTVLVTGASTGIGRATALLLAREGLTVYAGVRKDIDGEALGPTVTPITVDVTDAGQIAEAVTTIGRLDALVNNAGIGVTGGSRGGSAELLGQRDDDPLGAADVAEPVAVLVLHHVSNEVRAAGSQAGDSGVDVVDGEHHAA
jgi:NAD(P)-dependent dehydrogenase (short-subunit alcohol dehydrogenase family)